MAIAIAGKSQKDGDESDDALQLDFDHFQSKRNLMDVSLKKIKANELKIKQLWMYLMGAH